MESNEIKPEHNPWYLLATLYGEAESTDDDLHARNRTAWNRFMAAELTEDARALLIKEGRCSAEDLRPFSPEELSEVERLFSERHRQVTGEAGTVEAKPHLPNLKQDRIDFSYAMFDRPFRVKGFFFSGWIRFSGARFCGMADFSGARFCGGANFRDTTFSDWANFQGVTFSYKADFQGAIFSDWANFQRGTFFGSAYFADTTFSGPASFSKVIFSDWAVFSGSPKPIPSATFFDLADFSGATFEKETLFVNAKMEGPTSFEDAEFSSEPPQFFEAKLHQGTVWRGVPPWPLPGKHEEAGSFIDAYACLKLEMDRLKKHEDELDFFALELQSRRVLSGDWQHIPLLEIPEKTITPMPQVVSGRTFAPPPYTRKAWTIRLFRPAPGLALALYGWLSDFGRSYVRPLYGLLITVAAGVPFFWWHLSGIWQAVGHSFANTFGVLGFRKDLIDPNVIAGLPGWLKVIAASQTIAGIVLLFLFGLAIRNRFRMK